MIVDVSRIPQVPLDFINQDHAEEGRLLNALAQVLHDHRRGGATVEAVLHAWEALFLHTRDHFGREEAAMQRTGFPPTPVHQAEHRRVLEELEAEGEHFRETGDTARLGRYVSEAVPAWFVSHIQTMDLVTAQWVSARGG